MDSKVITFVVLYIKTTGVAGRGWLGMGPGGVHIRWQEWSDSGGEYLWCRPLTPATIIPRLSTIENRHTMQ